MPYYLPINHRPFSQNQTDSPPSHDSHPDHQSSLTCGYPAVMILPHYYFHQTRQQLQVYYREPGQRLSGQCFAYNFPHRTGCDLDAEWVTQLATEFPNFAG
ncbi:hypothetical protein B4916_22415 [Yersinia intermedia]|nr:hypothetical protein B4916_22415 [Yersinia intermedia]